MVDASALVEYLLRTELGREVASIVEAPDTDLHVPAFCDVEISGALARASRLGLLDHARALEALTSYEDLPLTRYGHGWLMLRVYELAEHLPTHDAPYVALCERLDAALLTGDEQLTRTVGEFLQINVIGVGVAT